MNRKSWWATNAFASQTHNSIVKYTLDAYGKKIQEDYDSNADGSSNSITKYIRNLGSRSLIQIQYDTDANGIVDAITLFTGTLNIDSATFNTSELTSIRMSGSPLISISATKLNEIGHELRIRGSEDNKITLKGAFMAAADEGNYKVYSSPNGTKIKIQNGVTISLEP